MSKRNVVFNKPDEPLFLKKLKQEIGYCEGPSVDTKREQLPFPCGNDDDEEKLDDQPAIVVLKPGDLTAEEVELEKEKEEIEKKTAPADLSEKIIFHPAKKRNRTEGSGDITSKITTSSNNCENPKPQPQQLGKASTKLLSFNEEEEEEEEED